MDQDFLNNLRVEHRALFNGLDPTDAKHFFDYLFTRPQKIGGQPNLRQLTIGLYDPWCNRDLFPMGILWQAAPYSFCSHKCRYCYTRCYYEENADKDGQVKKDFCKKFEKCLSQMQKLNLPPRHISMANSTDVLQADLERTHRHVLFMLERLQANKNLFSSYCILTKSPSVLLDENRYVELIKELKVEVQVSIAFFRDDAARALEPGAPVVSERMQAVEDLIGQGVHVAVRVDPLFPRNVPDCTVLQGLDEDLRPLVRWAKQVGVDYIIGKPLKIPDVAAVDAELKRQIAPAFSDLRGKYWYMSPELQESLLNDMKGLCAAEGIPFEHCLHNILKRNEHNKL